MVFGPSYINRSACIGTAVCAGTSTIHTCGTGKNKYITHHRIGNSITDNRVFMALYSWKENVPCDLNSVGDELPVHVVSKCMSYFGCDEIHLCNSFRASLQTKAKRKYEASLTEVTFVAENIPTPHVSSVVCRTSKKDLFIQNLRKRDIGVGFHSEFSQSLSSRNRRIRGDIALQFLMYVCKQGDVEVMEGIHHV